jgi:3-polyprenyl-4-hydroxybenzoate decarboxylase
MQTVGRALDLFDIDAHIVKRWTESAPAATAGKKRRAK